MLDRYATLPLAVFFSNRISRFFKILLTPVLSLYVGFIGRHSAVSQVSYSFWSLDGKESIKNFCGCPNQINWPLRGFERIYHYPRSSSWFLLGILRDSCEVANYRAVAIATAFSKSEI